jgi:hypothetical protein
MVATLRYASERAGSYVVLEFSDGAQERISEPFLQRSKFLKDILAIDSNCEEKKALLPVQEQLLALWIHYLRLPDEQKQVASHGYLVNALQVQFTVQCTVTNVIVRDLLR